MKIVVAPNAFKGALAAAEAAAAMTRGVRRVLPEASIIRLPMADGGDGLLDVAEAAIGGERREVLVSGPLGDPVEAQFLISSDRSLAIIETARACGLSLIDEERLDPMAASSFGAGQLIAAALDAGASRLIIGLGGSATTDAGIGMVSALGGVFFDHEGRSTRRLTEVSRFDLGGLDERVAAVRIDLACDVDNPLCGADGAAMVYGPQKGADAAQLVILDEALARLADLIERDLGIRLRGQAGAGAGGGAAAGLAAFIGARLHRGAELVAQMLGLAETIGGADLVLTGEGRIDSQTCHGKAPLAVAHAAQAAAVPCVAIAGGIQGDRVSLHDAGFSALFSLCPGPLSLDQAMTDTAPLLADAAEQALRAFVANKS